MNPLIWTAIVAVVLGLLVVCVFSLRFACSPADLSAIHRNEELEQLRAATLRRVDARQRVVREVIDRRRTLAEAIERLEELDREWPDYSEKAPEVPSLGTREERSYHYLRQEVEAILRDRPEEATAVLRRLEKEYQQQQAREPVPSADPTVARSNRPPGHWASPLPPPSAGGPMPGPGCTRRSTATPRSPGLEEKKRENE